MAGNKTIATKASATKFLDSVEDETKRKDSYVLLEMMQKITGKKPVMWGESIVGFDEYHYKYDSGREGDMLITGFSPRKQNLTLYVMIHTDGFKKLLTSLGKHKTSKACLYIKRLSDVDTDVLYKIIETSYQYYKKKFGVKISPKSEDKNLCFANNSEVRDEYKND